MSKLLTAIILSVLGINFASNYDPFQKMVTMTILRDKKSGSEGDISRGTVHGPSVSTRTTLLEKAHGYTSDLDETDSTPHKQNDQQLPARNMPGTSSHGSGSGIPGMTSAIPNLTLSESECPYRKSIDYIASLNTLAMTICGNRHIHY